MRWCMNIATGSSSAIHRTSTGTRAFLQSARSANGVRLYFNRGKGLPDPEKLLQGVRPGALDSRGGRVHTRSSGGRAPNRARPSLAIACRLRAPAAGRWSFVRHRPSSVGGVAPPRHSMQRMRASPSEHFQVEHPRRLALTADAER